MLRVRALSFVTLSLGGALFMSASCGQASRNFNGEASGASGEPPNADAAGHMGVAGSSGASANFGGETNGGSAGQAASGEAGTGEAAGASAAGAGGVSAGGASAGGASAGGASAGGASAGGASAGGASAGASNGAGSGGAPPTCAYTVCPSGCKNLQTDLQNCGSCGIACPAGNTCVAGDCQVKDGYPCVVVGECQSKKCTTFYIDADGDTHGSPATPKQVCGTTPPAGYVASNDDCCDVGGDAVNIFHGQTAFFYKSTTSCGKDWDYDCSGNIEKEAKIVDSQCTPNPIGACPQELMWIQSTVPECGVSGSRSVCISPSGSGNTGNSFCASAMPQTKPQGCH